MNDDLDSLFLQAHDIVDPAARAAFLEAACANQPELRRRLENLLADEIDAEAFFTEAIDSGFLDNTGQAGAVHPFSGAEAAGTLIGRYKLIQKLGEGGFGSVWLAEQTEPVRREVALKIIKLGMDTREVITRFDAERQALAMMDHPNIAKVLDAGATEAGRPFFVMELVNGVRITDFCDQHRLPTGERLALFIKVCQAIQHAHQKGIIHRDIKPSNILVTFQDGSPVPKVIDFGIAKATQGHLSDTTFQTQLNQFLGTPAYMSPEQTVLGGGDIDTRSDIYSAGVLLYELLTGRTPFELHDIAAIGLDAMRKVICERKPLRPSTRLAMLEQDELATAALRRAVPPPRLVGSLRGDLDWIVMKCLEKDRRRRYETASDIAADILRHLNTEPVLARPPSKFYEFQKNVRRHKFGFAATAALIVILAAGILVSTRQAKIARLATTAAVTAKGEASANADAERRARKEAEFVTKFLQDVFLSSSPGRDGRTITVAENLDRAVAQLDHDFDAQPALRVRLQATLGATYQGLGLVAEAIPLLEAALKYYESISDLENPDTLMVSLNLTSCYLSAGRTPDALGLCERLLPFLRSKLGSENGETAHAMRNLGKVYRSVGRTGEALELFQQARDIYAKASGPTHPATLELMISMAACYEDLGRWDEAAELRTQALKLSEEARVGQRQKNIATAVDLDPQPDRASSNSVISVREWNDLPGKIVAVSAIPIVPTEVGITLQTGERYRLYPHPGDRWNTAPNRWKDVDYRGHIQQTERTTTGKPYLQLCYRIGRSNLQAVQMGGMITGVGPLYLTPSDSEGGGVMHNNTGSIRVKVVKVD